jgi:predicted Zn-dependent protease
LYKEETMAPRDSWGLSEEQLLRLGRDALWQGKYDDACEALSEYCDRLKHYNRPVPPAVLAYYGLSIGHSRSAREGLRICLDAISQDRRNPNIYLCLARLYVLANSRKNAVDVIAQGLRVSRTHQGLRALRQELGVRQKPAIPFLARENAVNVGLGRVLRRLKKPGASALAIS